MANLLSPDVFHRNLAMLLARFENSLESMQKAMPRCGFSLKMMVACSKRRYASSSSFPFMISAIRFLLRAFEAAHGSPKMFLLETRGLVSMK